MKIEEAISEWTFRSNHIKKWLDEYGEEPSIRHYVELIDMAIEALSAEAVPQSEQYKKGFEDAKRAFELEYARESENMRKRNAELEVMLNAQKAISADAVHGEWVDWLGNGKEWECSVCKCSVESHGSIAYNYCPMCGAKMKGGAE